MYATRSFVPASSPASAWIMLAAAWSASAMTASRASVSGSAGTVARPRRRRHGPRAVRSASPTPVAVAQPAEVHAPGEADGADAREREPQLPGESPASRVRKIAEIAR